MQLMRWTNPQEIYEGRNSHDRSLIHDEHVDHCPFLRTGTRRAETFAVVEYLMGVEYVPDLYGGFR